MWASYNRITASNHSVVVVDNLHNSSEIAL